MEMIRAEINEAKKRKKFREIQQNQKLFFERDQQN